jgi:hypothetical protein
MAVFLVYVTYAVISFRGDMSDGGKVIVYDVLCST